jgi:hypothetical protein
MEQREVVRFLTLRKPFAKVIRAELDGVDGHEAFCLSAVKKRRTRIANGRITLEGDPRSGRPRQSDLSESVRALIEESPFFLCKRMSQKLRIAKTTCLHVLHENFDSESVLSSWFRM